MIVLDTNVLSELMRPEPHETILRWLTGQTPSTLYVTTVSYAEILLGIASMPGGKRRRLLAEQAEAMFTEDFAGRILTFDLATALADTVILERRQRIGNRLAPIDGMIAAIAQAKGAGIASRDNDLVDCGVPLINPWDAT